MIIDSHLHWMPGKPDNNPEDLVNSGTIDGVWLLSVNSVDELLYGFANDSEIIGIERAHVEVVCEHEVAVPCRPKPTDLRELFGGSYDKWIVGLPRSLYIGRKCRYPRGSAFLPVQAGIVLPAVDGPESAVVPSLKCSGVHHLCRRPAPAGGAGATATGLHVPET